MENRLPRRLAEREHQHTICVICEGTEEEVYLRRLLELGLWDRKYRFTIINAKAASNIPSMYEYHYLSDRYEMVLILCDTDKEPCREYALIKRKIAAIHGNNPEAFRKITMFANPCTMQIILLHFDDSVTLKSQAKGANAPRIEKLCGISNYRGHRDQIDAICRQVTRTNYEKMRAGVEKINKDDTVVPSTNFGLFLSRFSSTSADWIAEINRILEK